MTEYKPQQLDKKWQQEWTSARAFEVEADPDATEVLLPGDVRLPLRACARRPRSELHHRRRDGAHQAHARLQRAAPVRLGRVRPAGRERRHQVRHAPRAVDAGEHRPHERAAPAARHQLRVGPRDRDVSARVLQVQPVDLPEDVRARARLPQALDRQLVSELSDRARQRAGRRRRLLALRHDHRDARPGAVVLPHYRLCRGVAEGPRHAHRVAGKSRRDAAQLDRALGGGPPQVSDRALGPRRRERRLGRGGRRDLHDSYRHDLRRDVRAAGARASAGRSLRRGKPGSGALSRARRRSFARSIGKRG